MIPNPYPNIKDLDLSDNKTLSSSKITALLAAKQSQLEDIYDTELEQTASGAVMSFKTAVEKPIRGTFQINPSLDGVSAVNVVRTGKNLFAKRTSDTVNGVTFTVNDDGSISLSGTATATAFFICFENFFIQSGTYTLSPTNTSGITFYIRKVNGSGDNLFFAGTSPGTANLASQLICGLIRVQSGINTTGVTLYPQLEIGSAATEYAPYTGNTTTISLGSTVYGGSVSVSEDGEVELTETWDGVADLSSLTWNLDVDTHRARTSDLSSIISIPWGGSDIPDALAENFEIVNYSSSLSLGKMTVYSDGSLIAYYDGENAPAGKFAYKLANPTTSDLTDITPIETLIGENNIWADTGSGEIVYMNTIRGIIENNKED